MLGWHLRTLAATKSDTSRSSNLFAFKYACLGNLHRGFATTRVGSDGVCPTHKTELDYTPNTQDTRVTHPRYLRKETTQTNAHTGVFAAFDKQRTHAREAIQIGAVDWVWAEHLPGCLVWF